MIGKSAETGVEIISSIKPSVSNPQFTHLYLFRFPQLILKAFSYENPMTDSSMVRLKGIFLASAIVHPVHGSQSQQMHGIISQGEGWKSRGWQRFLPLSYRGK